MRQTNYLLNTRFNRGNRVSESDPDFDKKSFVSILTGRSGTANAGYNGRGKDSKMAINDVVNLQNKAARFKNSLSTIQDGQQREKKDSASAQRQLKLSGYHGFQFPKRQRFNEDVQEEVQSQRSGNSQKISGLARNHPSLTRRILGSKTDLLALDGENNSRQSIGSKRQLTASELSRHFKTKNNDLQSYYSGEYRNMGTSTYKKQFLKKIADCGNPRYAASKASSFMGGLINGRHTKATNFYEADENSNMKMTGNTFPNSPSKLGETRSVKSLIDGALPVSASQEFLGENEETGENPDDRQIDEVTYVGDTESMFYNQVKAGR